MQWILILLVAAVVFGLCYLFDKGYARLFRNRVQHRTGLAVHLNQRYAVAGVVLTLLGIAAVFTGIGGVKALLWGGLLVIAFGLALVVYYLTFGIYYDEDTFLLTTFGKKSATYRFEEIQCQQLYLVQGGSTMVELHLRDGRSVSLQSSMEGTYAFLDHAFSAWCRQTGRDPENCPFHDPSQSCWFPPVEDA